MIAAEAETYLRCRLEDALMAPGSSAEQDVIARVRAAVAIGAVGEDVAETVLADADRAFRLRAEDDHRDYDDDDADDEAHPPRIVVCPNVIEQDWGTLVVTHLIFGRHETTIGASGVLRRVPGRTSRPHPYQQPWQVIEVIDGVGVRHQAHFGGGSSDTSFDGEYVVNPGLDPGFDVLTVAGRTIELSAPPVAPTVRIDPLSGLSAAERARRHLELISPTHRHFEDHDEARIARETFLDLGVDDVDAQPGRAARPARHPGPRRARNPASTRWLAIGATSPPVDGVVLTLTALADDGRVSIIGSSHARVTSDRHSPHIRLGAIDDLGRRYSGESDHSSSGGRSFRETQRLVPEIDSRASTLCIVMDTLSHQVLVDVPLDWQDAQ